ncbi:nucleoside hydrolase [Rhizobium laguerreae]|nr:nucleoside hydrolase [Rhizobium laguerreae]
MRPAGYPDLFGCGTTHHGLAWPHLHHAWRRWTCRQHAAFPDNAAGGWACGKRDFPHCPGGGEIAYLRHRPADQSGAGAAARSRSAGLRQRHHHHGGAAFCPGNTTPLAEFNFAVDPHAAAIVFDSGIPVTMIGLDVSRQATVTDDMIREVQTIDTPVAREAAHLLINYGSRDPCLHDPAAIAWMLNPEMFETVQAHVSICADSGPAAGQVVAAVSERHLAGRTINCTVAVHVTAEEFRRLFVDALR